MFSDQGAKISKIAIAGPGRSGTTVLVQLFDAWGFRTASGESEYHPHVNAGLESRIGESNDYEVSKDPWFYEYVNRLSDAELADYDLLIVPIRNRADSALSRVVQERLNRLRSNDSDYWKWDSGGLNTAGAVYRTDIDGVSKALAYGLWDLIERATNRGMRVVFLNFPKFIYDFDYLWSVLGGTLVQRIDRESAKLAWHGVVDRSKVHFNSGVESSPDLNIRELESLVEQLGREIRNRSSFTRSIRKRISLLLRRVGV